MTQMPKAYDASNFEDDIYSMWESSGVFEPDMSKKKAPYSIMMPPPNATGQLHLGHATMLAIEDILIRFKRMQGHPTLFLPGTDHAAIATQSVVERILGEKGIADPLEELGREGFLEKIREYVEGSKATIRKQVRKMGTSCDWSRERYTFSDEMNHAVNTLFSDMYHDGLIYRGGRIVNWDPKMQTTVSDDELEYIDEKTKFYYFQYGPVVIGTARPETKFGDKVIVVHPDDERYKDMIGKEFDVEWIEGTIKATVIADECIDMELGTGAMTITPAHSFVDFEIAQKHKLETPQIIDLHGKIRPEWSESCGGMDIFEAREKVVEILDKKGLLDRIDEEYEHSIAVNYRGKGVVEPQVMDQWFVDVNKPAIDWKGETLSIKQVLQDVVRSSMINIVPNRFEKTYFAWIDNLRDWCISRQIVWGHQIPVWSRGEEVYVGAKAPEGEGWTRDPDTLDTWFSSGLWTFSTLGWPEITPELEAFAPSSVLETGYDILFFWVARMIIQSTYALRKSGFPEEKSIPFKDVYLHGLIRDVHGKKMSKSRPETCIDPLDMIEKYGTDAVRLSLVIGSTPGNDMRLYEEKIAGYRNFVNKIWNGARFVSMNLPEDFDLSLPGEGLNETLMQRVLATELSRADKWMLTRLKAMIELVGEKIENYSLSDAGSQIYDFFWGEYCDWYLEMSKVHPNPEVLMLTMNVSLRLMHPFMPFVTEVIWRELYGETAPMLMASEWPELSKEFDFPNEGQEVSRIMDVITQIRKLRADSKVPASKKIEVTIYGHEDMELVQDKAEIIKRLCGIEELTILETGPALEKALSAFVSDIEIFIPLAGLIDLEEEAARLNKELENLSSYLAGLEKKLSNEAFVKNAPKAVIDGERAKLEAAQQKIDKIQAQLSNLG